MKVDMRHKVITFCCATMMDRVANGMVKLPIANTAIQIVTLDNGVLLKFCPECSTEVEVEKFIRSTV